VRINKVYKGYYSEHDWVHTWLVEYTFDGADFKAMLDSFLKLYPSRRQAIIDLLKKQRETEEVIKFLEKP